MKWNPLRWHRLSLVYRRIRATATLADVMHLMGLIAQYDLGEKGRLPIPEILLLGGYGCNESLFDSLMRAALVPAQRHHTVAIANWLIERFQITSSEIDDILEQCSHSDYYAPWLLDELQAVAALIDRTQVSNGVAGTGTQFR